MGWAYGTNAKGREIAEPLDIEAPRQFGRQLQERDQ